MNRPYKSYKGGKNGSGTYQAIINQIPPHKIFISGFAGNCGVLANKIPAPVSSIAIDLDTEVIKAWSTIPGVIAVNANCIDYITALLRCYPSDLLPQIFVFLDPPYLMNERSYKGKVYKHEMGDIITHERLIQSIINWPVNVCLSHYPCQFYDDALNTWRKVNYQGRTRKGMRTERLYMNYAEPTALHDYSFIGEDFRQRELLKKMQVNMIAKFKRMSPIERNFIIQSLHDKGLL